MIYLASSGDEVKIWDVPTFSPLEQFNPFDGSVSDVAWSHDGHTIASCCSSDNTVHLRLMKSTQSVPADSFVLPAGCQCLDYNSASRFLLCGCIDGSVHIWDRKSKAIKKSYGNLKHPVTVARWNWNDTHISVGLENGSILLYNVVTGLANSPMVAPSVNTIRQLKYNPYQKSSLVSVSDDGAVNFWDTNTRRLVQSFTKTHQAPARDLAFSPINDCLMVTVGLDKRAVFYDIQNKSPIKTLVAEQPLTSVDVMQDGATVVVGTTRGHIFFYDMRQSSTPVFNLMAHKSSVKHLSFVRKETEKSDSLSSLPSQGSRRQLPVTPMFSLETLNQNSNNVTNFQSPRNNSHPSGVDIFSPINNANKSSTSVTDKTGSDKSWMLNLSKSQLGDIFTTGEGVFSPLRQDNSQSINSTNNKSSFLNNSFLTQVLGHIEIPNSEQQNGNSSNLNTVGEAPVEKIASATTDGISELPANEKYVPDSTPNTLLQRGIGASPSLQQIASKPVDVDSPSFIHRTSPRHRTSPSRATADLYSARSLPRHGVSFEDRPDILGAAESASGSASHSPQNIRLRSRDDEHLVSTVMRNGPTSSSPVRSPTSFQNSRPPLNPSPSTFLAAASATPSVRLLVQDLLKEQLQEHQEQLKSDIRGMLGHSGYNAPETSQTVNSGNLPNQAGPGIFHAEFIRNLIREELEDVKDFIHKEFWCLQVELIKQVFQLQRRMEAGFQECMISPLLLDEIDRLREENTRLKKTF